MKRKMWLRNSTGDYLPSLAQPRSEGALAFDFEFYGSSLTSKTITVHHEPYPGAFSEEGLGRLVDNIIPPVDRQVSLQEHRERVSKLQEALLLRYFCRPSKLNLQLAQLTRDMLTANEQREWKWSKENTDFYRAALKQFNENQKDPWKALKARQLKEPKCRTMSLTSLPRNLL